MTAVVDYLVPLVLDNVIKLVKGEIELLTGVQEKAQTLERKLKIINGFLRDTEGKRFNNEITAVINQIREDVEVARDVIDDYVVHVAERSRSMGFFQKPIATIDYAAKLHEVNNKIDALNKSIDDVYGDKEKYGINKVESSGTKVQIKPDPLLEKRRMEVAEDDDVVGFDIYANDVIRLLKGGSSRRDVVSIVGMGGQGKTTLARKVYKDDNVKDHFDTLALAWAFVSKNSTPRTILISVLKCLKPSDDEDKELEEVVENYGGDPKTKIEDEAVVVDILKREVKRRLMGLRYLVVLDDIWKMEDWNNIQDAFPDEDLKDKGSRVLITSRELALHTTPSGIYPLPPLETEDSWKLFCKRLFRQEQCPYLELEVPGRAMVEKCKGLPLSIVVLAGLLQGVESSNDEWTSFNKDVISKIAEDEVGRVKDILKLSYDNLPRRLKPCFLFLGIFPVEYDIPVRRLIHFWIAEGLVQVDPSKDKSLEEVGDDNLKALVNRNLVQVVSKRSDGGPKTCRVHDHLRELCFSESNQERFFTTRTRHNLKETGNPRILSLHCSTLSYMDASACDHSYTRSLYCFGLRQTGSLQGDEFWRWLLKSFKLLRVLDIGQASSSMRFHKNADQLIHLRYLRVDSISDFLNSYIGELWNLETLDMSRCSNKSIPHSISNLKQLRHLYTSPMGATLPKLSERQVLWNLQTLSVINLNNVSIFLLEKGRFPNLVKLGLRATGEGSEICKSLLAKLQCLTHLKTLKLIASWQFTESHEFPPNLTKITLKQVYHLKQETISTLANIPTLRILKVSGSSMMGWQFDINVPPQGFKNLQVLQLTKNLWCKNLKLGEDAMPNLRRLVIKNCKNLTEIPHQLLSSTTLKEIEVCKDMNEILKESLKNMKDGCHLIVKD